MNGNFWTTTSLASRGLWTGLRKTGLRETGLRFRADESGVLEKPMIATLLCMLAVGGIGMDLVRLERDRTELQYTLDRAVLAAADLDQPLAPDAVVLDYMAKAGLDRYYKQPYTEITPSSKRVTATVDADFETYWMKIARYDKPLPLRAAATAVESIGNVEISLVLDVSGSMGQDNRLRNLKTAAKQFVQTMDDNTEDGKMTISIVPYSTQVSMPASVLDQLQLSDAHSYSHCINFDSDDYSTTAISTVDDYEQTMHFSIWGSSDYRNSSDLVRLATCASHVNNPERTVMLLEDDVDTLQDYIDDFEASDNTSIDVGMKWGVALLDPSMQPIVSTLASGVDAEIDPQYANRPVSYSDHETLKVIVLMTDGQNTDQYYVNSDYRNGGSQVWYNADERVYSTYNENTGNYFWHDPDTGSGTWGPHPFGDGNLSKKYCYRWDYRGNCSRETTMRERGSSVELSFADLFADTSLQYIYYYLFYDWMDYYDARDEWYYDVYNAVGASSKDLRTQSICTAAKDQGIIVFTIGFEAPEGGQTVLRDCASSDSHYYDVKGLEIAEAFNSIASAIRQLRLTE
ncbi:VWA domain-containing protein [Phaeobacter sp. B1627]|uniref:VWA domain-containing protein n=1 Tax=Phaeobacter sp. B1627 TaxID=2583809 RepID=UPI00111A1566|nr:VWA domain-containing protein [Phaeobacter sp. B1627]TNJ41810.1 hypothetical protein FGE21_13035 [Phaeobacter sp. B1627]